jgi:DNA polymerase-3 subunit delta
VRTLAKIKELQLKEQIKTGNFSNAYFIYGEESYLKEHYVSQLKKKIVDPVFESFNYHQFDGKDISLDDILKDAQMLPMMSEYNFVLVRDYPITKSKNDLKLLIEFLQDVPESTVFIMVYDAVLLDEKSATFKKLVSSFDAAGSVVNLEKRSENDVAKLLVSGAKKRGSSIDINNARYLISISGNDLKTLFNELDKLSYFAQGKEITKDIIDNMATKCLQARIYDISKAVVAGNSNVAYSALDTLFSMKEDPIKILAAIGGVYVDMYRVKCAKVAGYSYDDVAGHYNYRGREFALKNASRDCAKLTEQQLRNSLDEIINTDIKLKSTAIDKKLLLEELIIKLILIAKEVKYA